MKCREMEKPKLDMIHPVQFLLKGLLEKQRHSGSHPQSLLVNVFIESVLEAHAVNLKVDESCYLGSQPSLLYASLLSKVSSAVTC
ncbi:uncharacterized protein LOC129060378 isoform X3 [Pongo abelii]|uniref:uncharacterized protein LOC129060378 isoform X3 n=1 Tax=Pongo abelii TaxID=9601 RepID=UPI0023E8DA94|nr:uncharacterized protein LOC129060378 isoform X3 [Pongo abelii]